MVVTREDEVLARAAVEGLLAAVELTPKPGLPDAREADLSGLRWSARALEPGLAAMAAAARRTGEPGKGLRGELGAVGRSTERAMARADGGAGLHHGAVWPLGLHHGAVWPLGLLVAGAALEPGGTVEEVTGLAGRIAAHPDVRAPRWPSPGSAVSVRYGAAGAKGEARAGFPHVRRATAALRTARDAGAREPEARLNALLTIMTTLQDTGLLHTAGPHGLREVQDGAREVLDGTLPLAAFDRRLRERGLHPRGSGHLLAAALFLDGLR
ncbi:triphosphoribosyl-dephospho-CoA synthase [Streptomyces exfoliatus]|uniref:triphosphoribosyl-dephospho-CoA synthase n=1 Tax=Streptomyces exfoliatus TaxID=1905 RepID=UPI0004657A3B|nr:triphosphoribosyl-dephospho-CoA synthase [Streptomyces exfoliatus]